MLEGVTLGEVVKLVVEVLVDLAGSTVLDEQTTKDPLAAHPQNLPVIVEIPPSAKRYSPGKVCRSKTFATLLSLSISPSCPAPGPSVASHNPSHAMMMMILMILLLPNVLVVIMVFCVFGLYVLGHTGIGGTLALTEAAVTANAAGKVELTRAGARVHGDGLLDDEAIGNELADRLARVGVADLGDLIGVEPDLALADAQDGGREPLLGPQVNPERRGKKSANCILGNCPNCGHGVAFVGFDGAAWWWWW